MPQSGAYACLRSTVPQDPLLVQDLTDNRTRRDKIGCLIAKMCGGASTTASTFTVCIKKQFTPKKR